MSRAKRAKERKTQRKESAQYKQRIMMGGLLAVVVGIIALLLVQSQSSPGQTVVEEGERPAWQTAQLTDARTGETFTLADFDKKNVFVKVMSQF